MRHPGVPVAGTFTGSLNNDGETIGLADASLNVIQSFTYNDVDPWPVAADGDGYTLVLIAPESAPDQDEPSSWRSSIAIGGSPRGSDAVTFAGDPAADDDQDGQSAFLEFVLGSTDSDSRSRGTQTVGIDPQGYLVFEFSYNLAADGTTISIESSDGLSDWNDASAELVRLSTMNDGDGTATTKFRSLLPNPELVKPYFLRLRVTSP